MQAPVSLSWHDWSLHRKGAMDQARHAEKVKEAIRRNLADIVAEEAIITSDGSRSVRARQKAKDGTHLATVLAMSALVPASRPATSLAWTTTKRR